jgi:hypothetical protein
VVAILQEQHPPLGGGQTGASRAAQIHTKSCSRRAAQGQGALRNDLVALRI